MVLSISRVFLLFWLTAINNLCPPPPPPPVSGMWLLALVMTLGAAFPALVSGIGLGFRRRRRDTGSEWTGSGRLASLLRMMERNGGIAEEYRRGRQAYSDGQAAAEW